MSTRMQITMEPALQRRARARVSELGLSFAEYVRRAVSHELGEKPPKGDMSILFNLVEDGPPSDIARDKDKLLAAAVRREHRRKTRLPATPRRRRD